MIILYEYVFNDVMQYLRWRQKFFEHYIRHIRGNLKAISFLSEFSSEEYDSSESEWTTLTNMTLCFVINFTYSIYI